MMMMMKWGLAIRCSRSGFQKLLMMRALLHMKLVWGSLVEMNQVHSSELTSGKLDR